MTDLLEPGGALPFADINPARFIGVPEGVLQDYLPSDSDGLYLSLAKSLDYRSVPELLAADPMLPSLPWDRPDRLLDHSEQLTKWRQGLEGEQRLLDTMRMYLSPVANFTTSEAEVRLLLNDAVTVYSTLVKTVAKAEKWTDPQTDQALGYLIAELVSPQKLANWQWWNTQAQTYSQRKVDFIDDVLAA